MDYQNRKNSTVLLDDLLVTVNGFTLHLLLTQDEYQNILLNVYSNNNYLYGACGVGNSELNKSNPEILNKINLNNDFIPEYYLTTYTKGSTFGAMNYLIIWYHNNSWEVSKAPFLRPFFKELDSDGIYEVIEYFNCPEGKPFEFINGGFSPKLD